MKTKIPWLRLLAEGAVVVTSILMAFAIDASWDRRQDSATERKTLERLESGLQEHLGLTQEEQETAQVDFDLLEAFIAMTPDEAGQIPPDSTFVYLRSIFRPGSRDLNSTSLSATLDVSRQFLASDPPLQAATDAWQSAAVQYAQRLDVLVGLEQEGLQALAVHPEVRLGLAPVGHPFGAGAARIAREDDQVMSRAARKHFATRIKLNQLRLMARTSNEALELVRVRLGRR